MPNPDMTCYNLTVFVSPDHVPAFEQALEKSDDHCMLLDLERTIGCHVGHIEHYGPESTCRLALFSPITEIPDYGADLIEVYAE